MGEDGRAAAALALRSARLGRRPENPTSLPPGSSGGLDPLGVGAAASTDAAIKFVLYELDAAVVARGGGSIFDCKPRGTLSAEAERRFEAWVSGTPRSDRSLSDSDSKDER
jgi:hypothetical protein